MARMPKHIRQRLQAWHLKRIPFPAVPIIDPYNVDPLQNGSVFESALRQSEIDHIRSVNMGAGFVDAARLWSWVYARRKVGRNVGMGKTALLIHIASMINKDMGRTFFGWSAHWLCAYTLVGAKTRSLKELYAQVLFSLCNDVHGRSVIEMLRARLRRKVLMLNRAGSYEATVGNAEEKQFANDQWLARNNMDLRRLDDAVADYLSENKIKQDIAQAIAHNTLNAYLVALNSDSPTVQHNGKLINVAHELFLNEIARVVKVAEIKRLTILLDDFYRLIICTPPGERTELAAEIRETIRGGRTVATKENLYNWMAVIHTVTAGKFSAAWEERDLHKIAKLNYKDDDIGIALQPIPFAAGRQMLEAYLSSQRQSGRSVSRNHPFTPEALEMIAKIASDQVTADPGTCEPRSLLQAAFEVVVAALQSDEENLSLDVPFVQHVLQGTPLPPSLRAVDTDEDFPPSIDQRPLGRPCPCSCHTEAKEAAQDVMAILDGGAGPGTTHKILGYFCNFCNAPITL